MSTDTTTPVWKSSKGDVKITEMATAHIKNAINTVESELAKGITKGASVLTHLKNELSGRTDA
jgi:hypothetical protein